MIDSKRNSYNLDNPKEYNRERSGSKSSKNRSFSSWIQKYDNYATPITLNFDKKGKFSTIPGGLCTFFSGAVIILFIMLRCLEFFETSYSHSSRLTSLSCKNETISCKNDTIDKTPIRLVEDTHTLAFMIRSDNPYIQANIDSYV